MNSISSPFISLLSFCILSLHYEYLFFASAAVPYQAAPALYVFGDSLVDSGNNNFLQTSAKANYTPYGVDFFPSGTASGRFTNVYTIVDFIAKWLGLPYAPAYLSLPNEDKGRITTPYGVDFFPSGTASGRFTNGYTIVDFIAKWLGLPYAPAYLSLSNEDKGRITTGVNYASGAGGILSETGSALGEVLSMGEQTNYFNKTVKEDLPRLFKNSDELSAYLAKSIFVISIGSNDYINNYLQPAFYNSSKTSTPQQFGDILLLTLRQHLTNLYNLGGRKFVVFNIGPLGCLPAVVNSVIPKVNTTCVEDVNALVSIYNMGFPSMIQELSSNLQGSTFVRGEIYNDSYNKNQNPPKYGYIGGNTPCCPVGGNGTTQCIPNQAPCIDRNDRLYYDAFHPMQRVNYEVANGCFISSSPCVPINIQQLAQQ